MASPSARTCSRTWIFVQRFHIVARRCLRQTLLTSETWIDKGVGGSRSGGPADGGGRRGGGPKGGGPRGVCQKGGRPKISRFLFPLPPPCSLFLFSLGGSSREIVSAGWGHGLLKLCVWASLGSFCVSPDDPEKRAKMVSEEEKKSAKFWEVRRRGVRGRGRGQGGPGQGGPGQGGARQGGAREGGSRQVLPA